MGFTIQRLAASVALVSLAVTSISLTGCAQNHQVSPASTAGTITKFGPAPSRDIVLGGRRYELRAGPIRADLIQIERLEPVSAQPAMADPRSQMWESTPAVYSIPGVPMGLMLRFPPGAARISLGQTSYPACHTSYVSVFTAIGVHPSGTPFSWPSPPADSDGHVPTPPPTPNNRPCVVLDGRGLLEAGWPKIFWDGATVEWAGVTYERMSSGYLDFGTADSSIPTRLLEPVETVVIVYRIEPDLPPELGHLVSPQPVTDHVRVYKAAERPAPEVILVDPCPLEFLPDEFVYYVGLGQPPGPGP